MKKIILTLLTLAFLGLLLFAGLFMAAIGIILLPFFFIVKRYLEKSQNIAPSQAEEPKKEISGETIDVEFTRVPETEEKQ